MSLIRVTVFAVCMLTVLGPATAKAQQGSLSNSSLTSRLITPALVTLLAADTTRISEDVCLPSSGHACGRTVVIGALGGFVAGFGMSLLYGLVVCLPKSFRDGEGCSGAVPVIFSLGGAAAGATLGLLSRNCKAGD